MLIQQDMKCRQRYAVHGLPVEIDCTVPGLGSELEHLFAPFHEVDLPDGFNPTSGVIRPYDEAEVLRHLSPKAVQIDTHRELIELYADDERYWLVDDRWGMAEINLLKGHWRAWVLPGRRVNAMRCVEMAVLWPLAQILRSKGLHLVPAASVAREGRGLLLLSPFGIERELTALVRDGYQLVGQRWTALREEGGAISLLHLPGRVERPLSPRLRAAGVELPDALVDLAYENRGATRNHAFLTDVLVIDAGRRPAAQLRELPPALAGNALRQAWPILEIHPHRRPGQLAAKLAARATCAEVQLSRDPNDLLALLRAGGPVRRGAVNPRATELTLHALRPVMARAG